MPKLTAIAAAQQSDESLELIASSHATGSGPTMWHQWQAGPGAEWLGWHPFGDPGTGDPGRPTMLLHAPSEQLEVFVVDGGQAVWHRRQTGLLQPDTGLQTAKWTDWESLGQPDGNPVQGSVAATLLASNQSVAVVVAGGAVWQTVAVSDPEPGDRPNGWDPRWSDWSPLHRPVASGTIESTVLAVEIATPSSGGTEIVARVQWPDELGIGVTYDRSPLWHRYQDPSAPDGWSDWEALPGPDQDFAPVGAPLLTQNFAGNLIVITRTSDGAVWNTTRQHADTSSWAPWQMIVRPGYSFGDLTVAVGHDGSLLLVAPTAAGNHLWYSKSQSAVADTWSPLSPLVTVPDASAQDPGALTCPTLVTETAGRVFLFVVVPATGNAYGFTQFDVDQLPVLPAGTFGLPDS